MLSRKEMQNRLLSGALGALVVSLLVVMASLTHAVTGIASYA